MTTNEYIGYFGAAAIVIPSGALVAKFAALKVARFQTRFAMLLISSIVAFATATAAGMFLAQSSVRVLVAWAILACCHACFLRSAAGDRLSAGKAFLVALCQLVGAVAALFVVLLVLGGIKHLFL